MLDRLFTQVVEDPAIDSAAFRELAHISGWDLPAGEPEGTNDIRRLVLARLAAEDWYDSLTALAERRGKIPPKKAKLARLMLGRIGKYWMPRVDRAALESLLNEFRTHERWLSGRIDPAWACTLERAWHRREIFVGAISGFFLVALVLHFLRLF